ncbi:MAG TPA: MFS transporter [Armatimonadota bacterium]|nr:MFS transporter [Armatimonadota bacterium]
MAKREKEYVSELEPEQQYQEADQALPQEPVTMGAEAWKPRLLRPLRAFRHRNYRLFFSGQVISLTGTWIQLVALGWLVLQLTNSALLLGVVSSIGALPILIFSLPAGVVADRFNKRNLIVLTQSCAMTLAFVLAGLTYKGVVNIYFIVAIGFLLGMVNAFDAPTRQSFVIEMVGREDLTNAIALNSAMFNSARIIGPAIAGALIAAIGTAGAFFVNGASFIAVITGLLLMQVNHRVPIVSASVAEGLREGFAFIKQNSLIAALLMLTAVVSIFSIPYAVLMPIFARDILHAGARGYGYLMSAVGSGALIGAATLSSLGDFPDRSGHSLRRCNWKGKLLLAGNLTFCTMLVIFSFSRILPLSLAVLVGAGWGMMTNMALTNTLIQTSVPDRLRGRVMSVYTLMFMGLAPIGSLQAGVIAHWLGAPVAIRIGAIVCATAALILSPRFIRSKE